VGRVKRVPSLEARGMVGLADQAPLCARSPTLRLHLEIQSLQGNTAEDDLLAPNFRDFRKLLDVGRVGREDDVGLVDRGIEPIDAPFHLAAAAARTFRTANDPQRAQTDT